MNSVCCDSFTWRIDIRLHLAGSKGAESPGKGGGGGGGRRGEANLNSNYCLYLTSSFG